MKSLDSRDVTNEITGFLYLWRSDKIRRIGRIFDIDKTTKISLSLQTHTTVVQFYSGAIKYWDENTPSKLVGGWNLFFEESK